MAIYHFSAESRDSGAGKPACQYVLRQGKYADRTKYSPPVLTGEGGLPPWAATAVDYFAAADKYEAAGLTRGVKAQRAKAEALAKGEEYKPKQGKALVAVSMDIAIPAELSEEQRLACVRDIVAKLTETAQGILPHAYALHLPDAEGDQRNHHLHIMLGFRPDDGLSRPHPSAHFGHAARGKDKSKGGAKKSKDLGSWAWLKKTRQIWQDVANAHLAAAGFDEQIDCRTNKARGIDVPAGKHKGPLVVAAERAAAAAAAASVELTASAVAMANTDRAARDAELLAEYARRDVQNAAAHEQEQAEKRRQSLPPAPDPRVDDDDDGHFGRMR